MAIIRIILAGVFGGCWGYAISLFAQAGNWAMVCVVICMIVAVFYLAFLIKEMT